MTILMAVDRDLVDALLDVLNDSDAHRVEQGDKPIGDVVREWANRADVELENAQKRQFFAEKPIRYEENGDCLYK